MIDNSSAWRMDPDVPLVVPEVNPHALATIPKGIVANPNCTTMVAMPVLKPLHVGGRADPPGREHLPGGLGRGSAPASPSSTSRSARSSTAPSALTFDGDAVEFPAPTKFPRPIAFNVLPFAGTLVDDGRTRPTRSRSSATRAARSSRSPTCRCR